ncbi:MAG: L,D-transpeptidase, partial [Candidatus Eremiobacteraeota bacterium]|nr:L,D-transpeptidase [Candidatus Eremiobacteraeota bacterium]
FVPSKEAALIPRENSYVWVPADDSVKFWGVAIGGAQYPTPDGDFRILAKEKNPTWDPPAWLRQKRIDPGPDNPLGDRWMQITPGMVGIHGTNNPDSIGGVASLGCVRLYPEAIRALYDQVAVGTPVYVIYEQARVGEEANGNLVWSFFPDPYTKYYAIGQARAALEEARAEGHRVDISNFEIEERSQDTSGLITPLFGIPMEVKAEQTLPEIPALTKPTGEWLNSKVLADLGFEVRPSAAQTVITSPKGKTIIVTHAKVPLNPRRLPVLGFGEELKVEGHRWNGSTWLPIPMVLEYLEIPHEWDSRGKILTLN